MTDMYLFYIVYIMAPHDLVTQGARASATMIYSSYTVITQCSYVEGYCCVVYSYQKSLIKNYEYGVYFCDHRHACWWPSTVDIQTATAPERITPLNDMAAMNLCSTLTQ